MKLLETFLNLLFPPKCPFCGKVQDEPGICPECEKHLPWIEEKDAVRVLPGGLRCAGALWYQDLTRDGLLRLKFQGAASAAEPMGELIARCAAEQFSGEFDTVTWTPVSRKRLRKRGYDQAELLARSACRLWDTAPVRLLNKTVNNPAQSGLNDAAARRANVLGVYQSADPAATKDKRILLIDDICTTGSTLSECARVLREAGAAEVVCATVALTPPEKHHISTKNGLQSAGTADIM
jgi:ComF family protein